LQVTSTKTDSRRNGRRNELLFIACIAALMALGCQGVSAAYSAPALLVNPGSAIAFGNVELNNTVAKTISLTNSSANAVAIQSVDITGSSAFSVVNWSGAATLEPGTAISVNVAFSPDAEQTYNATLTVQTTLGQVQSISLTGSGAGPTTAVTVSISPTSASVQAGAAKQFTATVTGTTNTAVTWWVNSVEGGNTTYGAISSEGLYSAPSNVPSGSVTVAARSVADTTKLATAAVTVTAAPIRVTVSPLTASVQTGLTQQFTATVTGTTNTGVNWMVNGVPGGNSTLGTISTSGLFTAPAVVPTGGTVTIGARSAADSTKSGSASVTITAAGGPPTVTGVSPSSGSTAGGTVITITGSNFVTGATVLVGGSSATSPSVINSTTMTAVTPAHTAGAAGVWVTDPDGQYGGQSNIFTYTSGGGGGGGNNYYVSTTGNDANDGSSAHPWATINHADSVVAAGDTVHVLAGTYYQNPSTGANGSSTGQITYISDTQWGAVIVGNGDSVWLATGSYVTIEGFEITSSSADTRLGILFYGSHGKILGNKVHDIQAVTGLTGNGGAGISPNNNGAGSSADYTEVSGNLVYNIAQSDHTVYVHAIYLNGTVSNTVSNNLIYQCSGWGIEQGHPGIGSSTIVNNTIFACGGGIMIGSGGYGYPSSNNYVANNILVYNVGASGHGNGIEECCAASDIGTNNTYTNNLVYQNSPQNYSFYTGVAVNSITADPKFVNYKSDGSGNYQLQSSSPAVNGGTNQNAPTIDLQGGVRPINNNWSMGAYEYGSSPGIWPWF
jgi:hypothetical protein